MPLKKVMNYIVVLAMFSGALSIPFMGFAELRPVYAIMGLFFLIVLPFLDGLYFNKSFLLVFFIIVFSSIYNIYLGKDTWGLFLKQFVGVLSNALFFYILIKINDYDIKGLFKVYLNLAFLVALIGLVQVVSFKFNFTAGYDFRSFLPYWNVVMTSGSKSLRINSILPEPAVFCNVMIPALFVSLASFFRNKFTLQNKSKSLVIILAFSLSFSGSGYISAIFALLLLLLSYRRAAILGVFIAASVAIFLYNNVYDFRARIDSSSALLTGRSELKYGKMNSSVYALGINAVVAYNSFKENPIFGSGLGSHEISFEKDSYKEKILIFNDDSRFNRNDAASLFLRLLSETGLFGLLMFFIFIFRFYIFRLATKDEYLWIINSACLTMFFSKLLRMGHYFVDGFFFFFWLYYFSKKMSENIREAGDVAYR